MVVDPSPVPETHHGGDEHQRAEGGMRELPSERPPDEAGQFHAAVHHLCVRVRALGISRQHDRREDPRGVLQLQHRRLPWMGEHELQGPPHEKAVGDPFLLPARVAGMSALQASVANWISRSASYRGTTPTAYGDVDTNRFSPVRVGSGESL